jgi:Na+-transporting methylmalonyl-CoA/oxaloacetate decarboxylase gamma subunit
MVIQLAQTAVAPENGGIGELLVYQLTGFLIVILVLCSLWFAVSCLGYLFRTFDIRDPVEPLSKQPADASARMSQPTLEVTPEVIAVVGAALHTVIQGPFDIVSVEESKPDQS